MGLLDVFKKKLNLEDYASDYLLNEPWMEYYLIVILYKPKSFTKSEFETHTQDTSLQILNKLNGYITPLTQIQKTLTTFWYNAPKLPKEYMLPQEGYSDITEDTYFILIRFPDAKFFGDVWAKKGGAYDKSKTKSNYKFSPIQFINFNENNIRISIDYVLRTMLKIDPADNRIKITKMGNEIIINEFNGIQYFYYPLSKRIELYSKYPEIEELIFSSSFSEFSKWLFSKDKDVEFKKNIIAPTKKLLQKYKVPF